MECAEVQRALHAYVDHELEPDRVDWVRSHVDVCASCDRRLAELESLGRLIRVLPYHEAPSQLRSTVPRQSVGARGWRRPVELVAALAIGVLLATSAMWLAGRSGGVEHVQATDALVRDVVNSHVRALMGTHLLDVASADRHTVKPWFVGKLDYSPQVNDLASIGFPLMGGRLDYLDGRAVAAIVYGRRQHVINVFAWPDATAPAGVAQSSRGFHLRNWSKDGMTFWAVSDLNTRELDELVRALQQ